LNRYQYACRETGKKVLDLGCGVGYGAQMLSKMGKEVVAVDVSSDAIDYAKAKYPGPSFVIASGEKLPFSDKYFDSVIAYDVIEHVEDQDAFLDEIRRVLKKEGTLFISTPNPRCLSNIFRHFLFGIPWPEKIAADNIFHTREHHYRAFIELLRRHNFKIHKVFGQSLSTGKKWMRHFKLLSMLLVYSGYFFPFWAITVVVKAGKME